MLVACAVLAGGGYLYYRWTALTHFAKTPHGRGAVTVEIPRGSGPRTIAHLLATSNVVSSEDQFYWLERKERNGPKLEAGEYQLELPLTPEQVMEQLRSGRQKLYHFTVPEGLRVDETLPIIAHSELHIGLGALEKLSRNEAFIHQLGVPADSLEGFLFPDTYSFTKDADARKVLTAMVHRALDEFHAAQAHRKPSIHLDLLQTMTLASIIEKETGAPADRAHISCVFHNRLRDHMKLQTDPTVLYAMMLTRGHWVNDITTRDLKNPNPYNTYTHYGLPPGPIASPGEAAILAAVDPLDCNDLYFVSRNDGTSVFCPTLKCHNRAVQRWQREYFRRKRHAEAKRSP